MKEEVKSFAELKQEERSLAGGKGGTLAHLFQEGYPVPDGFVILPGAFSGDELSNDGWQQVQQQTRRSASWRSSSRTSGWVSCSSTTAASRSFPA